MRSWRMWLTVWVLVVAAAIPAQAAKRVALVIGNSAYVNASPLANPANDADDVAAKLKALGFEVTLGLNLDKRAFDQKLREFSGALESAQAALVFYAGHGLQIAGRNYLIPVDAKLEKERDVEFEAVNLDFILKQMELDRADKTNIVFLDACRNNPLTRNLARTMGTRAASVGSGLAETFAGVGTFISYSTQPGNVALDGEGRNSPFAAALVNRMASPGKSLTSLMIDVRKDVVAATDGKQVPWDHSALTGEFFFDPNAKPDAGSEALQGRIKELEDQVKSRTDIAAQATLTQLKQRVTQMEQESRRDWDQIFKLQRERSSKSDNAELSANYRETGQLQIGIVKRSKDIQELKAEIAKIEDSLGVAKADEENKSAPQGAPRTLTPAPAAEITPPAGPATVASPEPAAPAAAPPVKAKQSAKPKKAVDKRKPQPVDDSNWNRQPLGP